MRKSGSVRKRCSALKRETPKAAPTPLKKTSIETAKSASPNAYLYRGLFSRVRVVPALRALGVSLLRGLHEREIRRKGKCRLDKGTRRHPAGWHRGQQAREGSGTRASESFASSPAGKGPLP